MPGAVENAGASDTAPFHVRSWSGTMRATTSAEYCVRWDVMARRAASRSAGAMHDDRFVRARERVGDLAEDAHRVGDRQRALALEASLKRTLHGHPLVECAAPT